MNSKQVMQNIEKSSEEEVFLSALAGNGAAITKICYYYASTHEEFQDLRQDVLVNLWESRKKFRGDCRLSTWIYRIALNTCISAFRKKRRSPQLTDNFPEIPDDDPRLAALHNEMHDLISKLSASDRALILLWLDELTYNEISEILGIPRNTIASKLRRVKEKIVKLSNS